MRPVPRPVIIDRVEAAAEHLRYAETRLLRLRGTPEAVRDPSAISRALSYITAAERRLRAAQAERDAINTTTRTNHDTQK